VHWDNIGAV
jgi:hypothetical protein